MGKWHLGFEKRDRDVPTARGFSTYFGYLSGGEDYYTHRTSGFVDLTNGTEPSLEHNGSYSALNFCCISSTNCSVHYHLQDSICLTVGTTLFAAEAIRLIQRHDHAIPFFLYLAFQSVHSPLMAPPDYIARYDWIHDQKRRVLAAMTSVMDDSISAVVGTLRDKAMWDNTLLMFAADNGGWPWRHGAK